MGFSELQSFGTWLVEAFGAVSSLLICVVAYQAYQLHQEQKESKDVRELNLQLHNLQVQTQLRFAEALERLRVTIEERIPR